MNFTIRSTSFIGSSGAGKTTVLKALINLVPITQGNIIINNKQLDQLSYRQRSEQIGYVFQSFNLFSNLTVVENCMDPLLVHGIDYESAKKQALQKLQKLNMEPYINQYPCQLSGGQQQRVAIARSLCLNPQVLLLDEPTASLDPINTTTLVNILKALATDGLILGISSQDMSFVNQIFNRVYYIEKGKIVEFCDDKTKLNTPSLIATFVTRQ